MLGIKERNWIVGAIFTFAAIMGIAHISWGRLTGDEGWYLYAGRLAAEGKLPYQDFFFTQAPLLPYIYGNILKALGENYYTGRMISLILLMSSMAILLKISRDLSGPVGECAAVAFVGLNLFVIMQGCSVMTPALAMFLIMASILFLKSSCSPDMRAMLSVLLLCLAAMVRLSILPAIPLLIIYLYYAEGKRITILITGIGTAALSLCSLLIPLAFAGGPRFSFGVFGFHAAHRAIPLGLIIKHKLGFIGGCISDFLPVVFAGAILAASLVIRFWRRPGGEFISYLKRNHFWAYLAALAGLITLCHFIVTLPYPTYEVMLIPVIALVIAGWISSRLRSLGAGRKESVLVVVSVVILACLSMPLQEFVLDTSGGLSPIREITEVCRLIALNARQPVRILTLDAGIAYQGGFDLLPGLEMSEFSYFPAWSKERCRAYNVVNGALLREAIDEGTPDIIALRNRDIHMIGGERPAELMDFIRGGYRWINTATQYGQFYEPLHIFKKKEEEDAPAERSLEPEYFPEITEQLFPW